ncbi:MAG: TolB family protein, partial [Vicinamibacteria bacterium]
MMRNPFGKTIRFSLLLAAAFAASPSGALAEKRPLAFSDLAAMRDVSDPQLSPDGEWVAYTVRTANLEKDRFVRDVWMASWDGSRAIQLTHTREESESRPRFSPDGRYLAFVASRGEDEDEESQVWLLDRSGGEARKLTSFPGGVADYVWSPDSSRLAVIASDPDPDKPKEGDEKKDDEEETPKPIVIDRYQFKEDVTGYLRRLRDHLYVFDIATEKSVLLTPGDYDESL